MDNLFPEIEELKEKLESKDPSDRQEACYLLGKLEIREAFRILEKALEDPDNMVQLIAQKSLSRLEMLGLGNRVAPVAPAATASPPAPFSLNLSKPPPTTPTLGNRTRGKEYLAPISSVQPVPSVQEPLPSISPTPVSNDFQQLQLPPLTPEPTVPEPPPRAKTLRPVTPPPSVSRMTSTVESISLPPIPLDESSSQIEQSAVSEKQSLLPPLLPPNIPPPVSAPSPNPIAQPELANQNEQPAIVAQPPIRPPVSSPKFSPPPSAPLPMANVQVETTPQDDLGGRLEAWRTLIGQHGDAFAVWFSKQRRGDKIDILSEIETSPTNILWSKRIQPLLYAETDPFPLSKLLKVFGHLHGPRILKYVEPFLEHADTRVVSNCLEALSLAGDREDLERVTQFLDHPDARIKSTAAQSLWKSNPEKAMQVVKRLSCSSRIWERDAAKFALASCPLKDREALMEELTRPKKTAPAKPEKDPDADMPDWARSLGPSGKALVFPVYLGLAEPIPVWGLLLMIILTLIIFFGILNPIFNWLFPIP